MVGVPTTMSLPGRRHNNDLVTTTTVTGHGPATTTTLAYPTPWMHAIHLARNHSPRHVFRSLGTVPETGPGEERRQQLLGDSTINGPWGRAA